MLTVERRRSILQILQREDKVLASELSKLLQVSEDTISWGSAASIPKWGSALSSSLSGYSPQETS